VASPLRPAPPAKAAQPPKEHVPGTPLLTHTTHTGSAAPGGVRVARSHVMCGALIVVASAGGPIWRGSLVKANMEKCDVLAHHLAGPHTAYAIPSSSTSNSVPPSCARGGQRERVVPVSRLIQPHSPLFPRRLSSCSSMQHLLPEELQVQGRVNLSKLSKYVAGLSAGSRHRTLSLFVRPPPQFFNHLYSQTRHSTQRRVSASERLVSSCSGGV
jgi:hypothetical protein